MKTELKKCLSTLLAFVLVFGMCATTPLTTNAGGESLTFDGTQSSWAEPELQDAYDFGLTYPEIMKNYGAAITREEFCTIVVKLYEALTGTAAATVSPNPFTDTNNPEILKANNLKIVYGTSEDKFTPYANITRQEICVMIFRALDVAIPGLDKSESGTFNFTDTSKIADWAYSAVRFCNKNGIMNGTSSTTIDPLNNATREQAIALLKRTYVSYVTETEETEETKETEETEEKEEDKSGLEVEFAPKDAFKPISISSQLLNLEISALRPLIPNIATSAELTIGNGNLTDPNAEGLEFLGRGYNVLGDYASPDTKTSLRQPVLNVKKMVQWRQVDKITDFNLSNYFQNISRSAYEYCNESTSQINIGGGFMGFSASVETNFGSKIKTSSNKYLATVTYWVRRHEYQIVNPLTFNWKDFIYPDVAAALNDDSISPAQILDTYGNYVITDPRIGGRLDYNVSFDSQYNESFSTFSANVKGSFNLGFASAGISLGDNETRFTSTFRDKAERNVRAIGGILDSATIGNTTPEYAAERMDAWRQSLQQPGGSTLCDFGGQALKPIWELCNSKTRAKAIKDEFENRVKAQTGYPLPGYVTDFIATFDSSSGLDGYFRAGPNLNEKGSKPIYLFYFLGENEEMAYTDIFATYDLHYTTWGSPWKITHNGNYADFYMRSVNVKLGASVAPVYLYGTYGKSSLSKRPIKKMEVVRIDTNSGPSLQDLRNAEPDWEWVTLRNETAPFNFNQGVTERVGKRDYNIAPVYIRFLRG